MAVITLSVLAGILAIVGMTLMLGMAATDGDSRELVASSLGLPNIGDMRAEVHAVDISVSSNAGTATVTYDTEFADSEVYALVSGDEGGDFHVDSAGSSQATIGVVNAETASGTVTAYVLVIGRDAQVA